MFSKSAPSKAFFHERITLVYKEEKTLKGKSVYCWDQAKLFDFEPNSAWQRVWIVWFFLTDRYTVQFSLLTTIPVLSNK